MTDMTDAELLKLLDGIAQDVQTRKDTIQTELDQAWAVVRRLENNLRQTTAELNDLAQARRRISRWVRLDIIHGGGS